MVSNGLSVGGLMGQNGKGNGGIVHDIIQHIECTGGRGMRGFHLYNFDAVYMYMKVGVRALLRVA